MHALMYALNFDKELALTLGQGLDAKNIACGDSKGSSACLRSPCPVGECDNPALRKRWVLLHKSRPNGHLV
jgi:hypothetical protein